METERAQPNLLQCAECGEPLMTYGGELTCPQLLVAKLSLKAALAQAELGDPF